MVEPEVRAVLDQLQVVVGVDGAAAVADDDACEVDALLLEDALLFETPRLGWGGGMGRDRDAGAAVCAGDGTQDAFHARGDSRPVGGALQDPRSYAGSADPLLDLPNEEVDHGFGSAQDGAGPTEVEVHRDLVVRVDPGRRDDVDLGNLRGDRRDARDVAAQADDGQVDERVDPVRLQLPQLGNGTRLLCGLVPLVGRLLDLGAQHEDVLVHQGATEATAIDRAEDRVDLGHLLPSPLCTAARPGRS